MNSEHEAMLKPLGIDVNPDSATEGYRRYGNTGPVDAIACAQCKIVFSATLYGWRNGRAKPSCPICHQHV